MKRLVEKRGSASRASFASNDDLLRSPASAMENKGRPSVTKETSYDEMMSMFHASSKDMEISFHVDDDQSDLGSSVSLIKGVLGKGDEESFSTDRRTKKETPLARNREKNQNIEKKKKTLKLTMEDLGLPTDRPVDPKIVEEAVKKWKKANVSKRRESSGRDERTKSGSIGSNTRIRSSEERSKIRGHTTTGRARSTGRPTRKCNDDDSRNASDTQSRGQRTEKSMRSARSAKEENRGARSKSISRRSRVPRNENDEASRSSKTSRASYGMEREEVRRPRASSVARGRGRRSTSVPRSPVKDRTAESSAQPNTETRRRRSSSVPRTTNRHVSPPRKREEGRARQRSSSVTRPRDNRTSVDERGREGNKSRESERGRQRGLSVSRPSSRSKNEGLTEPNRKTAEPKQQPKAVETPSLQRKSSGESLENLINKTSLLHPYRSSVEQRSVATTSTGSSSRDSKSKIKMQMKKISEKHQHTSLLRAPSGGLDDMVLEDNSVEESTIRGSRRNKPSGILMRSESGDTWGSSAIRAPSRNIDSMVFDSAEDEASKRKGTQNNESDDAWDGSASSEWASPSPSPKKKFGAFFSRFGKGNDSKTSLDIHSAASVQDRIQSAGVSDDVIEKLRAMGLEIVESNG